MKKDTVTVFEITDQHIKFLQGKGKGVVSACEVRPLADHTEDEIIKITAEIIRAYAKNIDADHCLLVIPR